MKTTRIHKGIKMEPDFIQLVKEMAERQDENFSQFVRRALRERIHRLKEEEALTSIR